VGGEARDPRTTVVDEPEAAWPGPARQAGERHAADAGGDGAVGRLARGRAGLGPPSEPHHLLPLPPRTSVMTGPAPTSLISPDVVIRYGQLPPLGCSKGLVRTS
jgi:hypothetical protein